jgi:ssDNA-binding replication factor A large subunit
MIKILLQDIIDKIVQHANVSEGDVNAMIKSKLDKLSGLISREGAAHIIANELGVKLFESVEGKLQIKNILTGMRSVETIGKVQQFFDIHEFETKNGRKGKVSSVIIADETGSIRIVLWGELAEYIKKIKEGDIIKIENGYVRENQGRKEVHMNDRGNFFINPEGVEVGDVKMTVVSNTRKKLSELQGGEANIEILGTIVQAFEPRFFEVCPECGKRARLKDDAFFCEVHDKVVPAYSYVMNVFLDDGTDNIRCVFFRDLADALIQKEKGFLLKFRENPAEFEAVKNELLGNIVKLVGRVNKNEMFDRLEFMTNSLDANPDPEKEIKKAEEKIEEEVVK